MVALTGANGAGFCIIMARDADSPEGKPRATMFLADMDRPGIVVERTLDTMGVADADFIGMSHGGVIALAFALGHPGRVRTRSRRLPGRHGWRWRGPSASSPCRR